MAQAENTSETAKRGHKSQKWNKLKRIGFHIDMTPYVDVIMLLLTFFIMTTTLNQPQVMQVNLPKGDDSAKVQIPMNNCVIIRVTEQGNIGLSKGKEDGTEEQPVKVSYMQLKDYLEKYGKENKDLTMILKFHRNARYDTMIGVIDEINKAAIVKRYSFSKMVEADMRVMNVIDG